MNRIIWKLIGLWPLAFLIAVGCLMSGCSVPAKTEVVAVEMKQDHPPMPEACHAKGQKDFAPVPITHGDKTPVSAVLDTLDVNKQAMANNGARAELCECQVLRQDNSPEDAKRLAGKCKIVSNKP